jgi:murein DD-endopeptidase MepM/ murein hydrolase activator NlpD
MLAAGLGSVALAGDAKPAETSAASRPDAGLTSNRLTLSRIAPLPAPPQSQVAPLLVPSPETQQSEPPLLQAHTPAPPPCLDDPSHPAFCVYTVEPGDTLSGIAQRLQVAGNEAFSPAEILAESNKPDVVSSDAIVPGQRLRIPKQAGIIVTVLIARPLSEIAAAYGVSADAVAAANGIGAGEVPVGRELLIPDPQQLPQATSPAVVPTIVPEETEEPPPIATPEDTPEPTATPTPSPTPRPNVTPTRTPRGGSTPVPSATPTPRPDRPAGQSKYGFIWPVWGPISSYFGPSHPLGIDIDLYEDPNAPIAAAKKGIVTFAGGNACCSYGLYVVVDHGDGTQTLYAHLSAIGVAQGQQVAQGQLIGLGGRTGYATGNHLHFEVHVGDNVVDPLIFLP